MFLDIRTFKWVRSKLLMFSFVGTHVRTNQHNFGEFSKTLYQHNQNTSGVNGVEIFVVKPRL